MIKKNNTALIILMVIVVSLGLYLHYLFTPVFMGIVSTSNGTIRYFWVQTQVPSFVIRTYLNGSPVSARIFVLINQPNNVIFYKKYIGSLIQIPFSAISKYVEAWRGWSNTNTSLLVFVSLNDSVTAMEIPYNPSWVLNNEPIKIEVKINMTPKVIKVANLTKIEQQLKKVRDNLKIKTSYIYCPYCHDNKSYNYIVDSTEKSLYTCGVPPLTGLVAINATYFYNFSVPLSWVTVSNDVNSYSEYNHIILSSELEGTVSWYAISTLLPYYLGPSYSTNVNWNTEIVRNMSTLSKLDNPTLYTYYNATIAVITYELFTPPRGPPKYDTVFEILSVKNQIGNAVETSNGFTCVIYNNLNSSNGKEYVLLPIGNGTVTYYYNLVPYMNMSLNFVKYGYANWNGGSIHVSGNVSESEQAIYFSANYLTTYITNDQVGAIAFDGIDLLLTALVPEIGVLADLGITVVLDIVNYVLLGSYTVVENYFINTQVTITVPYGGSGQLYVSFSNYTTGIETPLDGFILNYSSYYKG
ncbi:hypothetical protein [Stygiolobus caldivivus]|uniref:Uncharacterized protein n=1 Tax=Stygiolobus caldivivus TaxID=2824673 RepID=A0A8D5ZGN2_9CREN|nr:hypothetical protein [Stygiolobus caldivivus]BCU71098.1 hypothetical protein KN1_23950 [Stygiolobus caldivivus]